MEGKRGKFSRKFFIVEHHLKSLERKLELGLTSRANPTRSFQSLTGEGLSKQKRRVWVGRSTLPKFHDHENYSLFSHKKKTHNLSKNFHFEAIFQRRLEKIYSFSNFISHHPSPAGISLKTIRFFLRR